MPRKITPEFKRECAELVITHGNSHKDAAAAMNVGLSSIQRWVTQYRQELSGVTPKVTALTPEQLRIQELEKQLKQLQSDNELLKKASAFFAIEMKKTNRCGKTEEGRLLSTTDLPLFNTRCQFILLSLKAQSYQR